LIPCQTGGSGRRAWARGKNRTRTESRDEESEEEIKRERERERGRRTIGKVIGSECFTHHQYQPTRPRARDDENSLIRAMQTDRVPVSPPIVPRKPQRIMKIYSSATMKRDEDPTISTIAIID